MKAFLFSSCFILVHNCLHKNDIVLKSLYAKDNCTCCTRFIDNTKELIKNLPLKKNLREKKKQKKSFRYWTILFINSLINLLYTVQRDRAKKSFFEIQLQISLTLEFYLLLFLFISSTHNTLSSLLLELSFVMWNCVRRLSSALSSRFHIVIIIFFCIIFFLSFFFFFFFGKIHSSA